VCHSPLVARRALPKCITMPDFAVLGQIVEIWRFLKMTAAAILDFYIFEILTVGTVKRINVHHHTKFSGDRSDHSGDMVIFLFPRWRPSAILDL